MKEQPEGPSKAVPSKGTLSYSLYSLVQTVQRPTHCPHRASAKESVDYWTNPAVLTERRTLESGRGGETRVGRGIRKTEKLNFT